MRTLTIAVLAILWNTGLFAETKASKQTVSLYTEKLSVQLHCSDIDGEVAKAPYYCTYGKVEAAAQGLAKKNRGTLLSYEITHAPAGFNIGENYQKREKNSLEVTVKYFK